VILKDKSAAKNIIFSKNRHKDVFAYVRALCIPVKCMSTDKSRGKVRCREPRESYKQSLNRRRYEIPIFTSIVDCLCRTKDTFKYIISIFHMPLLLLMRIERICQNARFTNIFCLVLRFFTMPVVFMCSSIIRPRTEITDYVKWLNRFNI